MQIFYHAIVASCGCQISGVELPRVTGMLHIFLSLVVVLEALNSYEG